MLDVAHPLLNKLYDYWLSRAAATGRPYPLRSDIDPLDMRFCLGNIGLADIETPFRIRYRLVGTALTELYGADLTGRYVDQLYTPYRRAKVLAAYRRVVETGEASYDEPFFGFVPFKLGYHRLLLPLSSTGERVDIVLAGIYSSAAANTRAETWRSIEEVRGWLAEESLEPFADKIFSSPR